MSSPVSKTVWQVQYKQGKFPIVTGKKRRPIVELIGGLALLGTSTTHEIATFILTNSSDYPYYRNVRGTDVRILDGIYYNLLHGKMRKKSGRRKSSEKYPGIIEEDFVEEIGTRVNEKNRHVPLYRLTLKGYLFALGYRFNDDELVQLIKNAAKNHVYFSHLERILSTFSISYVKENFINPIQKLLISSEISLQYNDSLYLNKILNESDSILYNKTK